MSVIDEIAAERRRQIEVEGWTPEHDDEHGDGSLAAAAACYAYGSTLSTEARLAHGSAQGMLKHGLASVFALMWPRGGWYMKLKEPRRDLIRAAALLVAEIERLDRMTPNANYPDLARSSPDQ